MCIRDRYTLEKVDYGQIEKKNIYFAMPCLSGYISSSVYRGLLSSIHSLYTSVSFPDDLKLTAHQLNTIDK